ncbi:MAG: glycine oxidase ThiO [Deltaproteobacteria bacterium]|nr:glycine oxidase ThiO [Deltaproteobacteria bacterium]
MPRMLDVAVLGGGLVGCAIAHRLAAEGLRVGLYERGRLGGEASGAAAGMLGVQAEADDGLMLRLGLASRARYDTWLPVIRETSRMAVEWWREGTLSVCFSAADEAALRARRAWLASEGAPGEGLDAAQLRALEPGLSRRVRGGALFPLDVRLDNVALTRAVAAAAAAAGCVMNEHSEVRSVVVERGQVSGITTAAGRVACGTVVNALGAWAARVRGMTPLPVEPVRGQIAVLQARRPPFRHALYSPRGYAVARRDGRVLLGSTREAAGFEKRCTAGGLGAILSAGLELAPPLGALPFTASWSGLRPGSADGRPIVGRDPAVRGYIVATGHYRNGVLLAPLTADLVADLLRGTPNDWTAPLSLERFAASAAAARS